MKFETDIDDVCPSYEIAAYIDGELDMERETEIEAHFAVCGVCSGELNHQKQFLCSLNSSLRDADEIELPRDFTRQIVANAESSVAGLRAPGERFNALFIVAALSLFVLFALGSDASGLIGSVTTIFEKIAAVGGFFGRLVYSFFVGIVIVLRSLAAAFADGPTAILAGFAAVALFVAFLSRTLLRMRRF